MLVYQLWEKQEEWRRGATFKRRGNEERDVVSSNGRGLLLPSLRLINKERSTDLNNN